jgi:2-polyprenyl-6-methoxyphenol hydroxylase-like FAD-dependent oxidoreductase
MEQTVFISGGGPCGLAAALMFHQRGWRRIIVVEQSQSAKTFDKNKGFNYLIDARGQKLLKQLGLDDRLSTYGVENDRNIMTLVLADGSHKIFKSPFWDPARDSAYWSRRENLQLLLHDAIEERNDGRIELYYNHRFDDFEIDDDGKTHISIVPNVNGDAKRFTADLVLGCDGLKSAVREGMVRHSGLPEAHFERVRHPSPASELNYKVLSMPAAVPLKAEMKAADDNTMAYAFVSRHTDQRLATALVAYPVARADEPRTVNVIRLPGHALWEIETAEGVLEFLEDAFPQLPIRDVITQQEADDFVAVKASKFPAPQYTKTCFAAVGDTPVLLLGDAAHAFPPDLGLGVNTAMEDVFILARHLEATSNNPASAAQAFDQEQAKERAALVKLVQTVAPYQYNQTPWKLKLWALRFFAVKGLNRVLPFWVDRPAVLLAQQDHLRFCEIRSKQVANRFKIGALFALLGAGLVAIAQ